MSGSNRANPKGITVNTAVTNTTPTDIVGLVKGENGTIKQAISGTDFVAPGDPRLTDARPASDVPAWAKQLTKPSYSASEVGLGNVTNESKASMFNNPVFTGTPTVPTADPGTNNTQAASTAFVTAAVAAAGGGGGGGLTYDFELSENITAGNIVQLLTNGTIQKISLSNQQQTIPYGSDVSYVTGTITTPIVRFDPNNENKFVVAWIDPSSHYGKIRAGQISGSTITFGNESVFVSTYVRNFSLDFAKDPANTLAVVYGDNSNYPWGYVVAITIQDLAFTVGSAISLTGGTIYATKICFDASNPGKGIVAIRDSYDPSYISMRGFTISGTTISYHTSWTYVSTNHSDDPYMNLSPSSQNGVFLLTFHDRVNFNNILVAVAMNGANIYTASNYYYYYGNTASSADAWSCFASRGSVDSFVLLYQNSSRYPLIRVGSCTFNKSSNLFSLSLLGSSVQLASENSGIGPLSSDNVFENTFIVGYSPSSANFYSRLKIATLSGITLSFGSEIAPGGNIKDISSSKAAGLFIAGKYNTVMLGLLAGSVTNLSSSKLIGVLTDTGTTGQTKKVSLLGGIDTTRSGLTPGSLYYVQSNGSISTNSAAPAVYYGRAISTTAILTKQI